MFFSKLARSLDLLENEPAPGADFVQTGLNPLAHAFLLNFEEFRSAAGREQLFLLEGSCAVVNEAVVTDDVVSRLLSNDLFQPVGSKLTGVLLERSEGK